MVLEVSKDGVVSRSEVVGEAGGHVVWIDVRPSGRGFAVAQQQDASTRSVRVAAWSGDWEDTIHVDVLGSLVSVTPEESAGLVLLMEHGTAADRSWEVVYLDPDLVPTERAQISSDGVLPTVAALHWARDNEVTIVYDAEGALQSTVITGGKGDVRLQGSVSDVPRLHLSSADGSCAYAVFSEIDVGEKLGEGPRKISKRVRVDELGQCELDPGSNGEAVLQ